jgi:MFS family permease
LLWSGGFTFFLSFYLLLSALPLYAREIGVADRALGLVIGCFAFASMLVKPWAGWASDRFGRRPLLLAGAGVFLAASVAYGVSTTAPVLLLVRLVHGSGMGLFPTAASAAVADLAPPDRRGEYLGFFGAGASIAMATGPIAGMAIAERAGFASLFAVAALSAAVALALSAAFPETLPERRRPPLRLEAAMSRAAVPPSLVVLLLMLTYGAQVSFLPIYAHRQSMNAGLFFLVFALAVALVRGHAGRLSDRLGRVPVAVAGLLLTAAALTALAFTRDLAGLAAAGALYGAGFGTAQPALMAWCVDRAGPRNRGRAMGTYYTALELGIAGGATSSGLAVAAAGFAPTFLAAAAVAVGAAGLALVMSRTAPPLATAAPLARADAGGEP